MSALTSVTAASIDAPSGPQATCRAMSVARSPKSITGITSTIDLAHPTRPEVAGDLECTDPCPLSERHLTPAISLR